MQHKIKEGNTNTAARLRSWIQLGVFIVTIGIGIQFAIHVRQAAGDGEITVSRPPGVEGFLPIAGLMSWKLFITTGFWDRVHPAAMVILGFAAVISLGIRKSFCGWFCPVGTLSEWLWRLGRKMAGKNFLPPPWIDLPLRSLKYLLLSFFVWIIFSMDAMAIVNFIQSPYYQLSDVKMLHFFTAMTFLTAVVLLVLLLGSFFIRNFWCRYLCPYGALMGLLAMAGPTRITRDENTCIDCQRCTRACPAYLPVHKKQRIFSAECSGCMDCTTVCPVADTLSLKTTGLSTRAWSTARLGLVIIIGFITIVYAARISGHWESRISRDQFRMQLKNIDSPAFTHPGIPKKSSLSGGPF